LRVPAVARIKMAVFWVVAASIIRAITLMMKAASTSEISKLLPDYIVLEPRRQPSLDNGLDLDITLKITGQDEH
jgi:hypothetical protein